MPADFSTLDTEVGGLTSAADSAVALMDGFDQRLKDAITADNLSDNTNVARLSAEFSAQKTKLADAVTRNTPVAAPPEV